MVEIPQKELDRLNEYFGPEELDQELKDAMYEDDFFGTCIKHPLVFAVPYFGENMHKMYNEQLRQKTKRIKELESEKKYAETIVYYERPHRWDAMLNLCDLMKDKEFWKSLAFVYTDTENLWQFFEDALYLLESDRPSRENLMTKDERAALKAMDDWIVVYRGWTYSEFGMSWTTDKKRATWFAKRFENSKKHGDRGKVTKGKVHKSTVLAYFTGRSESEIVVNPDNVNDVKRLKI